MVKPVADTPESRAVPAPRPERATRRWLLLVHQLPARPSNLRVRTWRRLQQLGAVAVKQAVYALPDSPSSREDFEWLKAEIEGAEGEATVFAADSIDTWSDDTLVEEFRRSRQEAYSALARTAEQILRRVSKASRRSTAPGPRRAIQQLRVRFAAIERIDFFGSAGRDRVVTLLGHLEEHAAGRRKSRNPTPSGAATSYSAKLWVTRPRPGVDRMASAWLIRRFVDAEARFGFVVDRETAPRDAIPFDMFGVEFTHRGGSCTFEMLCDTFGLRDAALTRLAGVVHDLDFKDGRFGASEAPAIGMVIEGLRLTHEDDQALLEQGMTLFEALYTAMAQASRPSGPRPVAKGRTRASRRRRPGSDT